MNIQDQFKVNVSLPIDSRIVASGSSARDAIVYKYEGLRVFDTSDKVTYTWDISSATWSTPDFFGKGESGYITKWSSVIGVTVSPIFITAGSSYKKGNVGINTTSPQEVLQINSDSAGSQPFVVHKGSDTIIANNWYNTGSDSYFSAGQGSGGIKFRSNGEIWLLNRAASTPAMNTVDLIADFDVFGTSTSPNVSAVFYPLYTRFVKNLSFSTADSVSGGAYIRATFSYSTKALPDYTWESNSQTGIYHPASNKIGFTIGGNQKMMLTSGGLLISSSDNTTTPYSRLHLDGGNAVETYLRFTNGTTTGTTTNDGFLVGIGTSGHPMFYSRKNNNPYLFAFANSGSGGNIYYRMDRNRFTTYANPSGETFVSAITNNDGHRSIDGVSTVAAYSTTTVTLVIATFSVPNDCYFSIEATFVASWDPASGSNQFKSNKLFSTYAVDSSGIMHAQTTGSNVFSGYSLVMLSSPSVGAIANGFFTNDTANIFSLKQTFTGTGSGSSTVSFKATINTSIGY